MLSLGDSYTIGEGVEPDERWPTRLAAMLRARAVDVAEPTIVARTGWTTDELWAGIDAARIRETFDIVTLLIGVNDQYRGRSLDEYRQGFEQLVALAVEFGGDASSRVVVLSIPDWSVTPFADGRDRTALADAIDAFNALNRDVVGRVGGAYVNVTSISRRAAHEPELLAGDGLHPSGAMYAEWARLVLPVALRVLRGERVEVSG